VTILADSQRGTKSGSH